MLKLLFYISTHFHIHTIFLFLVLKQLGNFKNSIYTIKIFGIYCMCKQASTSLLVCYTNGLNYFLPQLSEIDFNNPICQRGKQKLRAVKCLSQIYTTHHYSGFWLSNFRTTIFLCTYDIPLVFMPTSSLLNVLFSVYLFYLVMGLMTCEK